ncbi:MAG: DNA polymerase [Phycisphaerales bacterium]
MRQEEFAFGLGLQRNPKCTLCPLHKTTSHVCLLGQGPKQSDVMIVGEAPGKREEDIGKPFQGKAGMLLEEVIEEYGFERRDVFITNAVSCRPPENRTPTKREVKTCKVWLDAQIKQVKPKFVLLLGNTPLLSVTGATGIKSKRGKPFEQNGIIYLPTFHPAFILRDPTMRPIFERDIQLFRTLVDGGGMPREKKLNSRWVNTWDDFRKMLRELRGTVSFDIETTCLYPWDDIAEIKMLGFGTKKTQWSILINHAKSPWTKTDVKRMVKELTSYMEDCFLVTQNGKFDFLWMWVHFGVRWHEFHDFDVMLAHYMLDENSRHNLKTTPKAGPGLAQRFCGAPDWDVDADTKQLSGDIDKARIYHAHDLYYTRELRFVLGRMLNKEGDVKRVFEELMMPVSRLFTEIEYDGVCVDHTKFDEAEKYLANELAESLKELRSHEPRWLAHKDKKTGVRVITEYSKDNPFNWASTDQLKRLLFGSKKDGGFGLEPLDRTKTGAASTSESVLKRLDHACTQALMRYRGAKQQMSFFIEGWKPFLHWKDGVAYLHPSFKLHGTVTGRPSCEHPNLQQVPRDERIRSLITAPPGWVLVEVDLSQIELRIAAELANEREMLYAFNHGLDVHWLTAIREIGRAGGMPKEVIETAWAFVKLTNPKAPKPSYAKSLELLLKMGPDKAIELNPAWKELRKKAKAINFGYLYGMWWKKFKDYARDNYGVTVTDKEAEASRTGFFNTYKDFTAWHDKQRRYARRNGYVRTLTGRKRRLPQAMSHEDTPERRESERQAINSPVQGFAAELNLMIALQLREEFSRTVLRMVGTVHDAILMWVREEKVEEVHDRYMRIVRKPRAFKVFDIKLNVPLEGEAKIGAWSKGLSLRKWKEQRANVKFNEAHKARRRALEGA